jgi:hypothetical protein
MDENPSKPASLPFGESMATKQSPCCQHISGKWGGIHLFHRRKPLFNHVQLNMRSKVNGAMISSMRDIYIPYFQVAFCLSHRLFQLFIPEQESSAILNQIFFI